jgi:Flp pilus assembly protein CpaB
MRTYQGKRYGKAMMLENGVVSWEYLTVTHGVSRMRLAVRAMTEEKSRRIRDFGGLLNQVGSAAITLDLNETLL